MGAYIKKKPQLLSRTHDAVGAEAWPLKCAVVRFDIYEEGAAASARDISHTFYE